MICLESYNSKIESKCKEGKCPFKHLLNVPGFTYNDCTEFGSSDCNLTMDNNNCCSYDESYELELKELLAFKYK